VAYFLLVFQLTIPERSHLMEYGILAVYTYEALTERRSQSRRVPLPALLAIAATLLIDIVNRGRSTNWGCV
jgi:hypothetical protein